MSAWGGIGAWLDVLGCPVCQSALRQAPGGGLHCPACARPFPQRNGIFSLLRQEQLSAFETFSHRYRQARLREGWRPLTPEQALQLPQGAPSGYPGLYWTVRRQSYAALMAWLQRAGPEPGGGVAADLGAGMGWLAYRLAGAGYRALALEASLDLDFGLGAAMTYWSRRPNDFLPLQADLEHPPFRPASLSLVIFNASLHYARDLAGTLNRAAQALRPDGHLIILDTPIAPRPRPGTGQGDRHLGRLELQAALAGAGLRARWFPVRRGLRWWLYQARAWLKRAPRFSFPMIVTEVEGVRE